MNAVTSEDFSIEAGEPVGNILFRFQELINRMFIQLGRLSEESQSRTQTLKKEYRVASAKSAGLLDSIGRISSITGGIVVIATGAVAFGFGNIPKDFQDAAQTAARQLPETFGGLLRTSKESDKSRQDSISGLRSTELSLQKEGDLDNLKQSLQELLNKARELFQRSHS